MQQDSATSYGFDGFFVFLVSNLVISFSRSAFGSPLETDPI